MVIIVLYLIVHLILIMLHHGAAGAIMVNGNDTYYCHNCSFTNNSANVLMVVLLYL